MDKIYADTVRLLLKVAPEVFASNIFAMKGGTAINLFVQNMPRLSVDINVVFRGTVLPIQRQSLSPKTADLFNSALELPILATAELYGSKLVAAMDRQHPRDLFDVLKLFESGGLSESAVECFVTYLAGHSRPIHEVLFGTEKDITLAYHQHFIGMTAEPVSLETLIETRTKLRTEIYQRLTEKHKQFLVGLARAQPDWTLLQCPHAADLPALRWKLDNLDTFSQRRPADFERQALTLENLLR
jgi:Nucleotidyl transferase AbiEii toxin, Type IV TA system